MGGWAARRAVASGFSTIDVLIVVALGAICLALSVPLAAHSIDVARARSAAATLAGEFRQARVRAVATRRATAVVFDDAGGEWRFRQCEDGNGNGVRRAELAAGVDSCGAPVTDLSVRFGGVRIGILAGVADLDDVVGVGDAVRFGASNVASCTPSGGCSPGSVYLLSPRGEQFAVRLGSMTGRVRVWRYESARRLWRAQ